MNREMLDAVKEFQEDHTMTPEEAAALSSTNKNRPVFPPKKCSIRETCTNCGSEDLSWAVGKHAYDPIVPDGRLRMSEIQVIAYLYCEECSETLHVIQEDEINKMLNKKD